MTFDWNARMVTFGEDVAMVIYLDFRDWWIGAYRGPNHWYICPLPCVVIRWERRPLALRAQRKIDGQQPEPVSVDGGELAAFFDEQDIDEFNRMLCAVELLNRYVVTRKPVVN